MVINLDEEIYFEHLFVDNTNIKFKNIMKEFQVMLFFSVITK